MPRINRFRVVNFSIQGINRLILDETFDFSGGRHAYLGLQNGGGKSILAQLMMQPVLPRAKIHGRDMASYFQQHQQPAVMMTEWMLDDHAGYLLTGVIMSPVERDREANEPQGLRYFTFVHRYRKSNSFDLMHIPVIERLEAGANKTVTRARSFSDLRTSVKEHERVDPSNFFYYAQEDASRYGRKLAEFGIIQKEWQTVITAVNREEGGLQKIFNDCRTSDQLLDKWLIKTIDEVKYHDSKQDQGLVQIFMNLAEKLAQNQDALREQSGLRTFLHQLDQTLPQIADLVSRVGEQDRTAGQLVSMRLALQEAVLDYRKLLDVCEQDLAEAENQRAGILHEKLSESHHKLSQQLDQENSRLLEMLSEQESANNLLAAIEHQQHLLEVREFYEAAERSREQLAGAQERLRVFEFQGEHDWLGALLHVTLIERLLEDSDRCQQLLEESLAARRDLDDRHAESIRQRRLLTEAVAAGRERTSALKTQEQQLEQRDHKSLERLGLPYSRNLVKEIPESEIARIDALLGKMSNEQRRRMDELQTELDRLTNESRQVTALRAEHQDQKEALGIEAARLRKDLGYYDQQAQSAQTALLHAGLDPASLLQTKQTLAQIVDMQSSNDHECNILRNRIDILQEKLTAIRNEHYHIPAEFIRFLQESSLPHKTGESYLGLQPADDRAEILTANPLLPYALLYARQDEDTVLNLAARFITRTPVPLICYEDLAIDERSTPVRFACTSENRVFYSDSIDDFRRELEQEAASCIEQLEQRQDLRQRLEGCYHALVGFEYPDRYRLTLTEQIAGNERQQESLQRLLLKDVNESARIAQDSDTIRMKRLPEEAIRTSRLADQTACWAEIQQTRAEWPAVWQAYTDSKSQDAKRADDLKLAETAEQELAQLQQQTMTLLGDRQRTFHKTVEQLDRIRQIPAHPDHLEAADSAALVIERDALSKQSTGQILSRYDSHNSTLNADAQLLRQQVEDQAISLHHAENRLNEALERRKLSLDLVHNLSVTDMPAERRRVDAEWTSQRDRAELIRASVATLEKSVARLDERCNQVLHQIQDLSSDEPLPIERILGDFERRLQDISRKEANARREKSTFDQYLTQYTPLIQNLADELADRTETVPVPIVLMTATAIQAGDQFRQLRSSLRKQENDNRTELNRLRQHLSDLIEHTRDIRTIHDAMDSLRSQWPITLTANTVTRLDEQLRSRIDFLQRIFNEINRQLESIEADRQLVTTQCFERGRSVCQELQKIADGSRIHLNNQRTLINLLTFAMQTDNDDEAKMRIRNYLDNALQLAGDRIRSSNSKDSADLRGIAQKALSSRNLLDQYLSHQKIRVKVYKIDKNPAKSMLKYWEDALTENSGGEKFVVYFVLLTALMSYTRQNAEQAESFGGIRQKVQSKTLIMDNPFGPISSAHLLRPLFQIADNYDTQLICLTDLQQQDIMSCFDVRYMIRVVPGSTGGKDRLVFGNRIVQNPNVHADEALEEIVYQRYDPEDKLHRQLALDEMMAGDGG